MTPGHFHHVCRSAAAIADVDRVTVFGAAAVVPWVAELRPDAPFWASQEIEVDPGGPELAKLVDESIGEGSLFEETFGVKVHGASIDAFVAPPDWTSRGRIFREPSMDVEIRTPHPLDLVVSRLVVGEARDWEFAEYCSQNFRLNLEDIARGIQAVAMARPDHAASAALALSLLHQRLKEVRSKST